MPMTKQMRLRQVYDRTWDACLPNAIGPHFRPVCENKRFWLAASPFVLFISVSFFMELANACTFAHKSFSTCLTICDNSLVKCDPFYFRSVSLTGRSACCGRRIRTFWKYSHCRLDPNSPTLSFQRLHQWIGNLRIMRVGLMQRADRHLPNMYIKVRGF